MNLLTLLSQMDAVYWRMPPQASTVAAETDRVFYYIYWCSVFFFVIINGAMFAFMIRYRRRSHNDPVGRVTHSTPLEITWSIIPSILLVPMFWWGFKGFLDQRTVPAGAMDISVDAKKWSWTFVYPNGQDHEELHVPVNKPVRLVMRSQDVIHSFFIPAFRVKRDVPPGRYSELWFTPTHSGTFPMYCAEYCGTSHSDMRALVVVHPTTPTATEVTYETWLETANPLANPLFTDALRDEWLADPTSFIDKYKDHPDLGVFVRKLKTPEMMGRELYEKKKGCIQCHSVTGEGKEKGWQGPTWKGLYGKTQTLTSGRTVTVDENYLRESMLDPNKEIVAGYPSGVMPKTRLNDKEIDCLIAYIKTLKD